jgi:PGAP1-like protein
MKDYGYRDVYSAGLSIAEIDQAAPGAIDPRSITIYRYYDQVSSVFGTGKQVAMEDFGRGLSNLILKLRDRISADPADKAKFKVYLIGHSMGGLVIRCFLQNDQIGDPVAKACVDKVFTYATPHNGIELEIIGNVPAFFTAQSVDNFNRERMRSYLGLPAGTEQVNTLNGKFNVDRFFCLIGTNPKDYTVAAGWSARVVGPFSDGLVRINNAVVFGPTNDPNNPTKSAPRAFVNRSHSGYYGIVNSEDGYQNLTRFLFGDVRVDGSLEVRDITLPREVEQARVQGRQVRASYQFEAIARVRGVHWDLSRRVANENSTVFRTYGELFPEKARPGIDRRNHNNPELFNVYLEADARVNKQRRSLGFSIDLGVLVPDYEIDGILWLTNHFPGGYIFRDKLNLEVTPPKIESDSWQLRYGFDSRTPNRATVSVEGQPKGDKLEFRIPIVQRNRPGIDATLVLSATS